MAQDKTVQKIVQRILAPVGISASLLSASSAFAGEYFNVDQFSSPLTNTDDIAALKEFCTDQIAYNTQSTYNRQFQDSSLQTSQDKSVSLKTTYDYDYKYYQKKKRSGGLKIGKLFGAKASGESEKRTERGISTTRDFSQTNILDTNQTNISEVESKIDTQTAALMGKNCDALVGALGGIGATLIQTTGGVQINQDQVKGQIDIAEINAETTIQGFKSQENIAKEQYRYLNRSTARQGYSNIIQPPFQFNPMIQQPQLNPYQQQYMQQ